MLQFSDTVISSFQGIRDTERVCKYVFHGAFYVMGSMHKFLECTDGTVVHYQCSEVYIYDTFAYECPLLLLHILKSCKAQSR